MQVKVSQAISSITKAIKARLVPMLLGSPGTGKSQIVHQIAKDYGLKIIDLRLGQCDPTDLLGFPTIIGNKADYVPMATFPIEGDSIPNGFNGWLLFLDEMNSAPPAVQASAYKLVLDRMVGSHHLHKNVAVVCAGNLETDNAIVQPMSTALQSRMIHLELSVDVKEWLDWAADKQLDYRITSYINFKPGNIYTFRPDHTDYTYACPRTWEFANRVLQVSEIVSIDTLPLLAGTLSEGVAREFIGFCKIHDSLPKIEQIIANPTGVDIPTEPGITYALTGSLSHHINVENADQLMLYISRLPVEFQVVCVKESIRRNKGITAHKAVQKWIASSAASLF